MKTGRVPTVLCNPIAMPAQILKLGAESPLKEKESWKVSTRQQDIGSTSLGQTPGFNTVEKESKQKAVGSMQFHLTELLTQI
jgi:hypothetical protein